jgi:glucose-1-phosphate cytidylyltransferase
MNDMKVVILCGGLGSRLAEETQARPKPMVEVGGHPILWHIMKIYSSYQINEFYLTLGYKGDIIKDYFLSYYARQSDIMVDLKTGHIDYTRPSSENWRVSMIDTGQSVMTGGRLLRLKPHLQSGGTFMLTYGDGVSDVNIRKLLAFHRSHGRLATVTAVRPPARFGSLQLDDASVTYFAEKPQIDGGWINGGFFVFEPEVFDYLGDDQTVLEKGPLERLCADDQLMAFKHNGYWQAMDTLRDKEALEKLWNTGKSPWRVW